MHASYCELPALFEGLLDRLHIERVIELDLQALCACFNELGDALDGGHRDVGRALDLARVNRCIALPAAVFRTLAARDDRKDPPAEGGVFPNCCI